jgi:glycosyltransferase involved in cell wall biosynthesis
MTKYITDTKVKLSIIIPSYNEEQTITQVIDCILNLDFNKFNLIKEILIINDGSTDNTAEILNKINNSQIKIINHSKNKGKGAAIRTGIKNASGHFLIIQDADLEQDPNDYYKLLPPLLDGSTKIVFGSRFLESKIHINRISYWGNKFFNVCIYLLHGRKLTDMWTGYKIAATELWKSIILKSNGFAIEPEIASRFLLLGEKIKEVPISFNPRSVKEGKHIRYRDGLKSLWILIACRFMWY